MNAIFNLAQNFDQGFFENSANEDALKEGIVEIDLFLIRQFTDIEILEHYLDASVAVRN